MTPRIPPKASSDEIVTRQMVNALITDVVRDRERERGFNYRPALDALLEHIEQRVNPPLPPTSEPIHDENCDALRSGSDMLEGILRACNCRPIPATSEPIPASAGTTNELPVTPNLVIGASDQLRER